MTLSNREKYLVALAVAAILALAGYRLALRPVMVRVETLRRTIPQKQDELDAVRASVGQYMRLEEEIERLGEALPQPEAGFSPLTFIEDVLGRSGIAAWTLDRTREERGERVVQESIEIRVDEAGWRELIEFFRGLEDAGSALRLQRVEIRRARGRRQGVSANVTAVGLRRPD